MESLPSLLEAVRACRLCEDELDPRPVVRVRATARILVSGQAPGRLVHASGLPFDDPSGVRLREWMGIDRDVFYDESRIAFIPTAFCYPGTGSGGDLPPPPRCAAHWHERLLAQLGELRLTLVVGSYAHARWFPESAGSSVAATVRDWRRHGTHVLPLPHPSPRNNRWLRVNSWFDSEVVPVVRRRVRRALGE